MNKFLKTAIDEALFGINSGEGGPFGAVIVKDGEVIAAAHNRVLATNDPTMHAEIAAIRKACALLGRFSLDDCEIYSTCQPCPMCLGAIIWAKIPKLFYGATAADAAKSGFDDEYIYDYIKNNGSAEQRLLSEFDSDSATECRELFRKWADKKDRKMY